MSKRQKNISGTTVGMIVGVILTIGVAAVIYIHTIMAKENAGWNSENKPEDMEVDYTQAPKPENEFKISFA